MYIWKQNILLYYSKIRHVDDYINNFTRFLFRNSKIKFVTFVKYFLFIQILIQTILYFRFFFVFFMFIILLIFCFSSEFSTKSWCRKFVWNKSIDLKLWFFEIENFLLFKNLIFAFWLTLFFCDQKFMDFCFWFQRRLQVRFTWNRESQWSKTVKYAILIQF